MCPALALAQGNFQTILLSSAGIPLPGVNVAVCTTGLTTTAASVTNNIATLTMSSNPITVGFLATKTLTVRGFTGGDTYFNGTFTIAAVGATTISYALTHANASAGTNGKAFQTGDATTACAPLTTLFTDDTGTVTVANPTTSDSTGNVSIWATAGNSYNVQYYGGNVVTRVVEMSIGFVSPTATFTSLTVASINNVVFWDGVKYPLTAAGLQSAISTACNGTIPGRVEFPLTGIGSFVTMTATVTVPSNCTLNGPGKDRIILQASASFNTPPVLYIHSVSKVKISGFGVDGNRANNANVFDCIAVDTSSDVVIDGVRASNCLNQGIDVLGASSNVTIQASELFNNGSATVTATGTGGIGIAPSGASSISQIRVGPNNQIHDNNGGVQVSNSTNAANPVQDVSVFENDIYANVNDGILATASTITGGKVLGFSAKGNRIKCNGWPANGTGFPSACTAGFLQAGAVSSGNGVGVDLITNGDQLMVSPIVANNYIHDNVFEGIAIVSNIQATVTVGGGTGVTQTAGALFNTNWRAGQTIAIGANLFKIASVGSTTTITLQTAAPNGPAQGATLPTPMWASVTGNQLLNNGNTLQAVGPGVYCQLTDHNKFGQNVYRNSNFEGLELFGCGFASVNGDAASGNNKSTTAGRNKGFASYGGFSNTFFGVSADDLGGTTQTVGLDMDANSTNNTVFATALFGSTAAVTGATGNGNTYIPTGTPTISSGFGTSPSITTNNGPASFSINVGTGGTAQSGLIGLPTAANGWTCTAQDLTSTTATVFITKQISPSNTTSVTIGNFNTAGASAAWIASDILAVSCVPR